MKGIAAATALAGLLTASHARADDATLVHVDTTNPNVTLEARIARQWVDVCHGSCDRQLSTHYLYRVAGHGVTPSPTLTLRDADATYDVHVATGNQNVHVGGVVLTAIGGASIVGGFFALAETALEESCSNCVAGYADTTGLNIAWTVIGAGAVALVVGIVMFASSRTHLTAGPTPMVPDARGPRPSHPGLLTFTF